MLENFESSLENILLDNSTNPKTYWKIMKTLIKSNKGSNCIPPLRNTINDEHLDEMVYDDDKKCELWNKYFSLVSKLEEENIPGPDKISHRMLEIAPELINEPLQIIFNKSLRQGKYPSSWKIAHVIAILKNRWCLLTCKLPSDIVKGIQSFKLIFLFLLKVVNIRCFILIKCSEQEARFKKYAIMS
jgi:hypothetical protein